ncbi:acyl-protein synthetase [Clostridium chromiireducens]|uniref:Acyl-protein synthetase, LuxE n=1 Tax=Clostridium chromiireducens TaxID=225345 RepID=A0A1V4ICM4_9CLOT|nr:acyl-protein synthetase [Clostridium chromiireducens]OPJ57752.1 acyl-protein synthetase, LuxE [Clostridium chromiireducens]
MIDKIINNEQFKLLQKDKESKLLDILKPQIDENRKNENLNSMYKKLGVNVNTINSLEEIPFIPVNMFKYFDLRTCSEENVIRILNSSSTTGNDPSKIYIDKETSIRQSSGLISTLTSFLGSYRRPMLVIDSKEVNKKNETLSARGAAIRGVSSFGKSLTYVMDLVDGNLVLNVERLKEFEEKYKDTDILVYGFTYIIWTRFVKVLKEKGIKLNMGKIKLLHSGGWKKLNDQKVEKEEFNKSVAEVYGTEPENIIDFYGMVEQLGVVFLDCECGYKHVPDFGEIIIRDFSTLKEVEKGQCGFIEVLSGLTSSYPGQAILTEDIGEFIGIDDCKCGRKGKYFKFKNRVEKSETRGCGDTFAERRDKK